LDIIKFLANLSQSQKIWTVIVSSTLLAFLWFAFVSNIQTSLNNQTSSLPIVDQLSSLDCIENDLKIPLCKDRDLALENMKLLQELKVELIDNNTELWALDEFNDLQKLVAEGDALFSEEFFAKSNNIYLEAILASQGLIEAANISIKDSIQNGYKQLLLNEWQEAEYSFRSALLIDPNHILANKGLSRSLVLEQILIYLDEARLRIKINSLDEAKEVILKAFNLDDENIQVQDAKLKVNQLIRERDLEIAIRRGYNLLKKEKFKEAAINFNQALSIDQTSEPAKIGLIEVAEGIKRAKIRQERALAQESFNLEDFSKSATHYKNILGIDKSISFAVLGLREANNFIALEKNINRYLNNPERLSSSAVYNEAQRLITFSSSYELRERLLAMKNSLIALLNEYSQLIKLTISSDNKTNISIVNGSNLGSFTSREMKLFPGTYTLIGKRKGYITVREVINLTETSSLRLACNKKI